MNEPKYLFQLQYVLFRKIITQAIFDRKSWIFITFRLLYNIIAISVYKLYLDPCVQGIDFQWFLCPWLSSLLQYFGLLLNFDGMFSPIDLDAQVYNEDPITLGSPSIGPYTKCMHILGNIWYATSEMPTQQTEAWGKISHRCIIN